MLVDFICFSEPIKNETKFCDWYFTLVTYFLCFEGWMIVLLISFLVTAFRLLFYTRLTDWKLLQRRGKFSGSAWLSLTKTLENTAIIIQFPHRVRVAMLWLHGPYYTQNWHNAITCYCLTITINSSFGWLFTEGSPSPPPILRTSARNLGKPVVTSL